MPLAENRHHRRKKINEKKQFVKYCWKLEGEWLEKIARRLAQTPKPCSKACCGNPKRFGNGDKHGDKKKMLDSIECLED